MDTSEIVLQLGPFYHVTPKSKWASIKEQGLRPDRWNEEVYGSLGVPPGVFLTPAKYRNRWVDSFREAHENEQVVMIEIASKGVANCQVSLDTTSSEHAVGVAECGTTDFRTLLKAGVSLICHDIIAPEHLRCVGTWPAWRWEVLSRPRVRPD